MNQPDERIIRFIEKNHVLTLATSDDRAPYCCSIFYVFNTAPCCFYFMSAVSTTHIQQALRQPLVAGTILPGDTSIAKIQGVQFTGKFYKPAVEELGHAKKIYLKKFPLAHFLDSDIWSVEIETIKMTDNTLGFGKKILWNRVPAELEA